MALSESILKIRRGHTHHRSAQREQRLEERIQRKERVLFPILTLESFPVESDVPIRQLVHKIQQSREHGVEAVRSHLLVDELDERLTPGKDPSVHDIVGQFGMGVVFEVLAVSLCVEVGLAEEESGGVKPGEEDSGYDFSDTIFSESEVVATDDGGVDQEHSVGLSADIEDKVGKHAYLVASAP